MLYVQHPPKEYIGDDGESESEDWEAQTQHRDDTEGQLVGRVDRVVLTVEVLKKNLQVSKCQVLAQRSECWRQTCNKCKAEDQTVKRKLDVNRVKMIEAEYLTVVRQNIAYNNCWTKSVKAFKKMNCKKST